MVLPHELLRWFFLHILINEIQTGGAVFGSIVGGSKIDERKRCAQEVAKRNVSGVYGQLLLSDLVWQLDMILICESLLALFLVQRKVKAMVGFIFSLKESDCRSWK